MRLGVDIRCLQDKWRTGVGEYTLRTLRAIHVSAPEWSYSGYANSLTQAVLPPELPSDLKIRRGRLPNKLNNLRLWLGLGPAVASTLGLGDEDSVMWFPNPLFASFDSTPVVLTVHDLAIEHYPEFFPRRGRLWYVPMVRDMLRRKLPALSAIVAVSEHTAQDVAELVPRWRGRVSVAYPGVEQRYFEKVAADDRLRVRQRYGLPERYILSLGTIEPRKNYALLLQAFETYARLRPKEELGLVIAGAWGWRTEAFKRALASSPAADRVRVLGYVRDEDKPALYSSALLFAYPSYYEGFGMPVMEAMASGCAVVASSSSSLPEAVGEAGVLVSPLRPEQWVQAFEWLLHDESARQRYMDGARRRAQDFTWDRTAQAYRRVFTQLSRGEYEGSH